MRESVILLGSDGFVGKKLAKGLGKDIKIYCFDREKSASNSGQNNIHKKKSIEKLVNNDLPESKYFVINLVAKLGSADYSENFRDNVLTVRNLISLVNNDKNCKGIIHFSSISAERRISAYGRTKALGEKFIRIFCKRPYMILRSEMIIGEGARSTEKLKKASTILPFITFLPKGGKVRRYPVNIEEVVNIVRDILVHKTFKNETFLLCADKDSTIREMVRNYTNNIIIPVPGALLVFFGRILELIYAKPWFTKDNAVGLISDTNSACRKLTVSSLSSILK